MSVKLGELTAEAVMTRTVVSVDPDDSIVDALAVMEDYLLSALPVIDRRNKLVGMLSSTDLVEITREIQCDLQELAMMVPATSSWLISELAEQGHSKVSDVMSSPPITVQPGTNLVVAARMMLDARVHRIPVVDSSGAVVGIISTVDFVKAFAEAAPSLAG